MVLKMQQRKAFKNFQKACYILTYIIIYVYMINLSNKWTNLNKFFFWHSFWQLCVQVAQSIFKGGSSKNLYLSGVCMCNGPQVNGSRFTYLSLNTSVGQNNFYRSVLNSKESPSNRQSNPTSAGKCQLILLSGKGSGSMNLTNSNKNPFSVPKNL